MTLHVGSVGPPIRGNTMEPEVFRQALYALSGGRTGIVQAADFAVTQNGTPNMSVNVGAGIALVAGTSNVPVQGPYNAYNDAAVNLAIAASNATNPRIDVACLTIDDQFYGGPDNTPQLQIITGTPAASPAVPAVPANSLVFAHIYVGAAVTSITNSNINTTTGTGNPDVIAFVASRCIAAQGSVTGSGCTITATSAPGTVVAGLFVAINAPANHNIRVRYSVQLAKSTSTVIGIATLYRDGSSGTLLAPAYAYLDAGLLNGQFVGEVIDQPSAGVHSYGLFAYNNGAAQTMTFTAGRGTLTVEDAGAI